MRLLSYNAVLIAGATCMICVCSLQADDAAGKGALKGSPAAAALIKDFSLSDTKGKVHTSTEWKNRKAVVLFFIGTECPVSNGYAPEYVRLAKEFADRGIRFYGIHPDPDVTAATAAKHAADYHLTFAVLLDPAQAVTKQAGVKVVPQAVAVSAAGHVFYRGRIDDRYSSDGKRRDEPLSRDLHAVLAAVAAGKTPAFTETKAFGCPLPAARRDEPAPSPKRQGSS
jgi:peroxiredoxin